MSSSGNFEEQLCIFLETKLFLNQNLLRGKGRICCLVGITAGSPKSNSLLVRAPLFFWFVKFCCLLYSSDGCCKVSHFCCLLYSCTVLLTTVQLHSSNGCCSVVQFFWLFYSCTVLLAAVQLYSSAGCCTVVKFCLFARRLVMWRYPVNWQQLSANTYLLMFCPAGERKDDGRLQPHSQPIYIAFQSGLHCLFE